MRKFAVVVVHEWVAQRNVAIFACALAAMPWLLGHFPGVGQSDRDEVIRVAAAVLGGAFALSFAILLGATMIARDVAERRFPFYMSQPVRGSVIFLGKWTANSVLVMVGSAVAGAAAIAAAPSWGVPALAAIPVLVALSNHASLVIRAGGGGFLVDLVLLPTTIAVARLAALPFETWGARYAGYAMSAFWGVAGIAALLVAGIAQVRAAGFDIRAAAARSRLVLWRTTFVTAIALDVAYAFYVLALPSVRPTS